jgi:hypothetical protein
VACDDRNRGPVQRRSGEGETDRWLLENLHGTGLLKDLCMEEGSWRDGLTMVRQLGRTGDGWKHGLPAYKCGKTSENDKKN